MTLRVQVVWQPRVLVCDPDNDKPGMEFDDPEVARLGIWMTLEAFDALPSSNLLDALGIEAEGALHDIGTMLTNNEIRTQDGEWVADDYHQRVVSAVQRAVVAFNGRSN